MKILLINPPNLSGPKVIREGRCEQRFSSFQYVMVPISLPMIAGLLLKNNCEVKIIDFMVENYSFDDAVGVSAKFKPNLVIFNFSTLTYKNDLEFVRRLRGKLKSSHFSAIGVHVSALDRETLQESKLDSIIRGEPEMTALKLVEALKGGKQLRMVRGLTFRQGQKIIKNPDRPLIKDLDSLPFAARHLLRQDRYFVPVHNRPYTLLITGRGCPNRCNFCTARQYYGNKFRSRKPEKVIQEIEQVVRESKISDFTMWADTFTFDKNFVMELCGLIKAKNLKIHWMCNARVNTVDLEMLKAMKEAGCFGIAYGVESGNQQILNNIKKGTTLAQIEKAFEITREAKVESLAHVIFGLPGETKATIEETLKFIDRIDPDYAQFYCAVPFPGTEFRLLAKKEDWITTDDWDQYEINQAIIETATLSREELANARRMAVLRFYLRKKFILRQLKGIKSFRELLNLLEKGFSFLVNWS